MSTSSEPAPPACRARFSNGRTAASEHVTVRLSDDGLTIDMDEVGRSLLWPYGALRTSLPLSAGVSSAVLSIADHQEAPLASLFIDDARFLQALAGRAPHLSRRRRRVVALAAGLAGLAAIGLLVAVDRLTAISLTRALAGVVPQSAWRSAGENIRSGLADQHKECSSPAGRVAIDQIMKRLTAGMTDGGGFDVRVVDWEIVNAFTVPGRRLLVTRGLLQTAKSGEQIAAVLAHEIGHGLAGHPEAALVRAMGLNVAAVLVTGSNTSLGNVAALLLQLRYSREAEREADAISLSILRGAALPGDALAEFFDIMGARQNGSKLGRALEPFATHPALEERAQEARAAARYPTRPLLSDADLGNLRRICDVKS